MCVCVLFFVVVFLLQTLKPFCLFFFFFFFDWHMKGSPSKLVALQTEVTGSEKVLFAGASVHHSARKFYRLGQCRVMGKL